MIQILTTWNILIKNYTPLKKKKKKEQRERMMT